MPVVNQICFVRETLLTYSIVSLERPYSHNSFVTISRFTPSSKHLVSNTTRTFLGYGLYIYIYIHAYEHIIICLYRVPRTEAASPFGNTDFPTCQEQPVGSIVILDHLNINHEKGRHELLRAFYFDFLGCAVAPRKEENLARGAKTLWANVGFSQFHLPEGRPGAQVFDGIITLVYRTLKGWLERYEKDKNIRSTLEGTQFRVEEREDEDDNRRERISLPSPCWIKLRNVLIGGGGGTPSLRFYGGSTCTYISRKQ